MFDSEFKIIYFILYVLIAVVRKAYTGKYRSQDTEIDKKTSLDLVMLGMNGIAMILPLVYVFSTALDFASYDLPGWLGWVGTALFLLAILVLWRSHADLGNNWTVTVSLKKEHTLVTGGIYKYIRHPMYAAHLLWAIAQILMLPNWIAAWPFLFTMMIQYLIRVRLEEDMMTEKFGDEYLQYISSTGRLFPKGVFQKD